MLTDYQDFFSIFERLKRGARKRRPDVFMQFVEWFSTEMRVRQSIFVGGNPINTPQKIYKNFLFQTNRNCKREVFSQNLTSKMNETFDLIFDKKKYYAFNSIKIYHQSVKLISLKFVRLDFFATSTRTRNCMWKRFNNDDDDDVHAHSIQNEFSNLIQFFFFISWQYWIRIKTSFFFIFSSFHTMHKKHDDETLNYKELNTV